MDFPEAAPIARVLRAFCTGVESLRLSTFGSRAHLARLSLCPKITFPRKKETGSREAEAAAEPCGLCGGRPRPELGPGFFEPTVITGVDSSMQLFRDETFGPILAVQVVRDAEEAVRLANDTEFALSASVWTRDRARGRKIAQRLRAGTVLVNDAICGFAIAEAPHGGPGLSGWGRTHGKAGLLEMVHLKYMDVDRLPGMEKPWWYRYGADLDQAADAFLRFEFGGGLAERLRHARGAMKTMFRDRGF